MRSFPLGLVCVVGSILLGCSSTSGTGGPPVDDDAGTTPRDSGALADRNAPDAAQPIDAATDDGGTPEAGGQDSGVCSVVAQTGCQGTDKCTLTPSPACVANGTKQIGEACTPDDCARGGICTSDSQAAPHACHQFCAKDADCTQPAAPAGGTAEPKNVGHCIVQLTGTGYSVCSVPCNPVTKAGATGCLAGQACVYGAAPNVPELTNCATAGAGQDGATCTSTADCAAGFACVSGSGAAHCRNVCRSGMAADCNNSYACVAPSGVTQPMFGFCCPSGGC